MRFRWSFAAAFAVAGGVALAADVEVGPRRAAEAWGPVADAAVRQRAAALSALSGPLRSRLRAAGRFPETFFLAGRVRLLDSGRALPFEERPAADLSLRFDASGLRAFPPAYRAHLEATFAQAKSAMDAVFGMPAVGGPVKVKNYDADIQDRYAVAGGYYVPNAPGGPEIRFPVFNNPTAASVNFIHTLLLAYQHPTQPPFDAYSEGLVRAATCQVARVPGTVPASSPEQVETVLQGLYDVGELYDWFNSPGLGAPRFIAPNLLSLPLPPGGSTGGVFLLRYQMAGTCWLKLLAERPGFARAFLARYNQAPAAYQDVAALEALGQLALQDATGSTNATVEGVGFEAWAERQAILDVATRAGLRLVAQPFPAPPVPGSTDFGLFGVVLHAYQVEPNGNETLLSGDSYPLYFLPDFVRTFLSAQEDLIRVGGGFGSVVVNFPRDSFGGQPYRMAVDLPFRSGNVRALLPAGAVATGSQPVPNTFYGTLVGLPPLPIGAEYQVVVDWLGGRRSGIRVRNFAFGALVEDPAYLRQGPLLVRVYRVEGTSQALLFTRKVNKTPGSLALDLRTPPSDTTFTLALRNGLQTLGLPLEPYRPAVADVLGMLPGDVLWARWNPVLGRYDFYPRDGSALQGLGAWARPPAASAPVVRGRTMPNTPIVVALSPGWNMVSAPWPGTAAGADIMAATGTEAFRTLAEAKADGIVGPSLFRFAPSSSNPDEGTVVETDRIAAGEATWVRCDRAEGAVLLFVPRSANASSMPQRVAREASATVRARAQLAWEQSVELRQGSRALGMVRIGAAPAATGTLDPAFDSTFPGALASRHLSVVGSGWSLYRDIRQANPVSRFHLRLERLRPGVRYRLAPSRLAGNAPAVWMSHAGRTEPVPQGSEFSFVARAATETVLVEAVRR